MVIQVLAADPLAVSIRIVSPAENTGVRKVGRKEIAEPVDAVRGRPRFVSVAVQAVDGDDAGECQRKGCKMGGPLSLRQDWLLPPRS
jgi:hypothetical protein